MTKDVLVSVRGIHTAEADGENGNVEVITAGTYYYKNNKHYVIYDELVEGYDKAIRSTIRIGDGTVELKTDQPRPTWYLRKIRRMSAATLRLSAR